MYTGDCVLYLSGNNWVTIRNKIQDDLKCFENWGELNNLHLNVKKTKLMLVSTRSKLNRPDDLTPLILYDRPVDFVKQYNYLGVIIDSEMTLRAFYSHVKKIIFSKIFCFRKIRQYLTVNAAIMVYKHTILPFLENAGFMIIACTMEDRRELQKYQNEAL